MNFSEALEKLKDGMYLSRGAWGHSFVFIEGDAFMMSDACGLSGRTLSDEDVLASDWRLVD